MPAPLAAALSAAPSASVMLRSSTFISEVLSVVVVPLTVKFPVTINAPPTVISSGKPIVIVGLPLDPLTATVVSPAVAANVVVSPVAKVTEVTPSVTVLSADTCD